MYMAGLGKIKQQQGKKKMNNIIKKFGRMNDEQLNQLFKWKPKYNNINKIIRSSINWEKKLKNY